MAAHTKPLHAVLGGGRVADILLWRDMKLSAALLGGVVLKWFLFQAAKYTLITLLCHICMITMFVLLAWSSGAKYFNWNRPSVHYLKIPESAFRLLSANFNRLILKFYKISTGSTSSKHFVVVFGCLWTLSVIGKYISFLNLICLVLSSLLIGPVVYEQWGGR